MNTISTSSSPSPSSTPSPTPSVTSSPAKKATKVWVSNITLFLRETTLRTRAVAEVTIIDENGTFLPGVTVVGNWEGLSQETNSSTTNNKGKATLTTGIIWKTPGQFIFSIKDLQLTGYDYQPENNTVSGGQVDVTGTKKFNNISQHWDNIWEKLLDK